jgi:hypothetical protein
MKTRSSLLAAALIAPLLTPLSQAFAATSAPPTSAPPATSTQAPAGDEDIVAKIFQNVPDILLIVTLETDIPGTRYYLILRFGPVDHQQPDGTRMVHEMSLLHRSTSAPMVVAHTGYGANVPVRASQRELTYLLQGNQLTIGHRYFGRDSPGPIDPKLLNIQQAAADEHDLIEAFKKVYTGKWVSTGASKGGMASVYHRYFYPDDVDATVAYVAPSSKGPSDARYVDFVAHAGGEPACNEALRTFQKAALQRRDELLPLMTGATFDTLGKERAFEFAVVEAPFLFWQYGNASRCSTLPAPDAPASALFAFLDSVVRVGSTFGDAGLKTYAPYYFQAATELGAPRYDERHLHGLLRYPREDRPAHYPPLDVEKTFDHALMPQVERWVRTDGQRLLFIYGENDPWSTSAYEVRESNDAFRFFVPGGNHRASLLQLPEPQRSFALDTLEQWLGVPVLRPTAQGVLPDNGQTFSEPDREELFLR